MKRIKNFREHQQEIVDERMKEREQRDKARQASIVKTSDVAPTNGENPFFIITLVYCHISEIE